MSPRKRKRSEARRYVNPGSIIIPEVESDISPVNVGPIHIIGLKPEEIEKLIEETSQVSAGQRGVTSNQDPDKGMPNV
jgi:hypothetical protein